MMAIDNPILSLKNLNDLQEKVVNNTASVSDYEEIDFFISAIGGDKDYIKKSIIDNGFSDIEQYLKAKRENTDGKKVQIGIVYGTCLGALDFLKSYAIQNKFYL